MYYTEGLEIPRDTPAGGLTGVGGGGGSGGGGGCWLWKIPLMIKSIVIGRSEQSKSV